MGDITRQQQVQQQFQQGNKMCINLSKILASLNGPCLHKFMLSQHWNKSEKPSYNFAGLFP